MNGSNNNDVKSVCGFGKSIAFMFYPNEDNIRIVEQLAKESYESLWNFMCTSASLVMLRTRCAEDQSLYYHCKPDGYCAMRVWRLANLFFQQIDGNLPTDVDLNNKTQRNEFREMISTRYFEIASELNDEEQVYVLRVLDSLEKEKNHLLNLGQTKNS